MAKSVFQDLVQKAYTANKLKQGPITSVHQGLSLIEEEVSELRDEVYHRKRKDDPHWLLNELVDICARCELFAEFLSQER